MLRRVSSHDIANGILRRYQDQHGMVERFEEVGTQISELSRIVQTRDSGQSTASLGALTVVGLPLGTALSVLQILDIRGSCCVTGRSAERFGRGGSDAGDTIWPGNLPDFSCTTVVARIPVWMAREFWRRLTRRVVHRPQW